MPRRQGNGSGSGALDRWARRYRDVADARRMEQIRAGRNLDEQGIPFGTIPAAFIEERAESRLRYPGAGEIFRAASPGSGSILARVLSFDDVPAARLRAGYDVPAAPATVLDWYGAQLEALGWTSRGRRPAGKLWIAAEVFEQPRQEFAVTVPVAAQAQRAVEHHGARWPLDDGDIYVSVDYRIYVRYAYDRDARPH